MPGRVDSGIDDTRRPARAIARCLLGLTLLAIALTPSASGQIISPAQPNVWPGGRGVAVAVHPVNSSIAIVASESGGLFKTTDSGATWSHLNGLPPFRISDVKYDRVDSQLVVVTAWKDGRVSQGGGIWRSVNAGVNWQKSPTAEPPAVAGCTTPASAHGISFQPSSDSIYVGTDCGVAISRDHGATWTHVTPARSGANPRIWAVVAQAGSIVDACGDAGVFHSTMSGNSWGPASSAIGGCVQGGPHLIAVSPLEPNVLFVTTVPSTLFESDDGGSTWTSLNPPAPAATGSRPSWVKAHLSADGDPTHFDLYFGNAYNVVRQTCTSGGSGPRCSTSWNSITVGPNESLHDPNDLAFGPSGNSPRYLLSDSGVYTTSDGGATFTVIGGGRAGYDALQIYDVAGQIHTDHTDVYFGTQDNCLWASPDDARTWINPRCEEGFNLQMKRRTPSHANQTIVGVIPGRGNFFTSAHFPDFNPWNNPTNGTGNPFIVDTRVYLQYTTAPNGASTRLSLTIDGGTSWNPINLPNGTTPLTITNSLAHWPQVSGSVTHPTIYQAITKPGTTSNGDQNIGLVRMDVDIASRTGTVAPADVSGLGSLGSYVMGQGSFVGPTVWGVDPNDPSHLMAPDVGTGQMKVSRDGGATWTADPALTNLVTDSGQIPFNLSPSVSPPSGVALQVHSIAFDPDAPGRILVGTEAAGIFQSVDNGQTWSKIPFSDFFIRAMTSFFFDSGGSVLVSTYGHGLWRIELGSFPPPVLCSRNIRDCRIDVRDLLGEIIYPLKLCPRLPDPPACQFVGVDGGVIEDLELGEKGIVKRGAMSGKGLQAYRSDGKQAPLDLGIQFSKSTRPGKFAGCPACRGVLAERGMIRGFVHEKGQVLAIISEFGKPSIPRPVTAKPGPVSRRLSKPTGPASGRALPYLQLIGTLPITGQTEARTGDTVTAYGSGFCGGPTCSPVTLRIGRRIAAENVKVDEKGNFHATFVVTELPGQYRVAASQKSAKKEQLEDARYLLVPTVDEGSEGKR